jgi:hypothetical protein
MIFKVWGHRRSGTNLTKKLIEINFPSLEYHQGFFKHQFAPKLRKLGAFEKLPYPSSILVERNPRDVLLSQFHFYHRQTKCPFTKKVFKEFLLWPISDFAEKYNEKVSRDSKAYERQAKKGETPAHFLKRYLDGWGVVPVLRVKYEQISRRQIEFVENYGALIGQKPKKVVAGRLFGPGTYVGKIGYANDGWYDEEMNKFLTELCLI